MGAIESLFYTLLCVRDTSDPFTIIWEKDQSLYMHLCEAMRECVYNVLHDPAKECERLKHYSNLARLEWSTNIKTLPPTCLGELASVNTCQFGYIGRSLPSLPLILAEKKRDEAERRFRFPSGAVLTPEMKAELGFLMKRWTRSPLKHQVMPYSESASLITPKKGGGQAQFFRDLMQIVNCELKDPGLFYDLVSPHYTDYFNLMSVVSWLDDKYLRHIDTCVKHKCDQPELHFPFRIDSLPESGWRARCASLPWPTILFGTEKIRQRLLLGIQEDWISKNSFVDNFRELDTLRGYPFIESTDLSAATDNLSSEWQSAFYNQLQLRCKDIGYVELLYAKASFYPTRIVSKEAYKDVTKKWPSLKYFIEHTAPIVSPAPILLLTRYNAEPWMTTEFVESLPGVRESRFLMINSLFQEIDSGDKRCSLEAVERSLRCLDPYATHMKTAFKGFCDSHTSKTDYCYLKRKNNFQNSKHIRCRILDHIKQWYQEVFESEKGFFSHKGQHMSLPLSFMSLQAANVAACSAAKKWDHSLKAYVMGDDAVLGYHSQKAVDQYHKHLESTGARVNTDKSFVSTEGRLVFCEHSLDKNGWLDHIRVRQITQPLDDDKGVRWMSISQGTEWLPPHRKTCLETLKIVHNRRDIEKAIAYGYDPSAPIEFGGMGIPYHNKNIQFVSNRLKTILGLPAIDILKADHKLQRAVRSREPYEFSSYFGNMLFEGAEVDFHNGGVETHVAFAAVIRHLLPFLVFQENFTKNFSNSKKSPKIIGNNFANAMWKIPETPTSDHDEVRTQLKWRRHQIRIKSDYISFLMNGRRSRAIMGNHNALNVIQD